MRDWVLLKKNKMPDTEQPIFSRPVSAKRKNVNTLPSQFLIQTGME
jgi:hypothetical protein